MPLLRYTTPGCRAYRITTDQAIATGTSTAVQFNGELYDNDGMHDNTTNNTRITINTPGLYVVTGAVLWQISATGDRGAHIRLNGSAYLAGMTTRAASNATFNSEGIASLLRSFVAGDYLELMATQDSGGSLNALQSERTFLSAHWLSYS